MSDVHRRSGGEADITSCEQIPHIPIYSMSVKNETFAATNDYSAEQRTGCLTRVASQLIQIALFTDFNVLVWRRFSAVEFLTDSREYA